MSEENSKFQNSIWRTCNKLRAATFRIGIHFWEFFKRHDPNQTKLISQSKFINVLANEVGGKIGISNEEIRELTDYFQVQDGRVLYGQFCDVIHSNSSDSSKNPDLICGLEWEDPLQVNRLSESENRRLCVLLTKIAQSVRFRELILEPYFQDYELIAKNHGTITVAHFSRILHFQKLIISTDDFQLLLKRFMKDSYTVNYVAFCKEIEQIVKYLDKNRMIDQSGDFIENFPGRILSVDLPKLPRPEIGKIRQSDVFGNEPSFHSIFKATRPTKTVQQTLLRIMKHVLEYHIRISQYFEDFDLLRTGLITKSQFNRSLDLILLAGLHRLYLSDLEIESLCAHFADPDDKSRVYWKSFVDCVDGVFTKTNLEKNPFEIVIVPPQEVIDLKPEGNENWHDLKNEIRDLCTNVIYKIKSQISNRRLFLEPKFRMFDRHNISHVTRSQAKQVLLTNGLLISDEEMYAIEKRYNDDLGFNYRWFLNEADPQDYAVPKFEEYIEKSQIINAPKPCREPNHLEQDIVQVLGKIKAQAVRNRVRILEFLKDYDRHNEQFICDSEFRRGLSNAKINITMPEMDLICKVFKSPLRNGKIDYKQFCKIIEESFYQSSLEKAPLHVPFQHFPSEDSPFNFLNFDERTIVSKALQKLAHYPDQITNIKSVFTDFDRVNCGTISQNNLLRALTLRNLYNVISSREFEVLCKCFGVERGLRTEFDYRRFLNCLHILFVNKTNFPF